MLSIVKKKYNIRNIDFSMIKKHFLKTYFIAIIGMSIYAGKNYLVKEMENIELVSSKIVAKC